MVLQRICLSESAFLFRRIVSQWQNQLAYATVAPVDLKPNLNVGTIGHIDHGKTTLTAAISKYLAKKSKKSKYVKFEEIDKGEEEKRRGITITASHIGYETSLRRYSHTDCPGHKDFMKNMICGASQMDAAVLVVAATDGVMPQTRQHVMLAKQTGVKKIVVFINKADAVDSETSELVELEARDLLSEHGFEGDSVPVVLGSALASLEGIRPEIGEDAIGKLLEVLDGFPQPERNTQGALIFPVDRIAHVAGRGSVLIGTVETGTVKKGSKCRLLGEGETHDTVATDIQVYGKSLNAATAGEHVGILVRGLKKSDVHRGQWLTDRTDRVKPANRFLAQMYILTEGEGGAGKGYMSGSNDKVHCTMWSKTSRVSFPKGVSMVMPGEVEHCEITLYHPMPMVEGLRFTLRRKGQITIGAGVISAIHPRVIEVEKKPFGISELNKLDEFIIDGRANNKTHEEKMEEWEKLDVDEYAEKVVSSGEDMGAHLASLNQHSLTLDKQLRKQISSHHEKLLSQAMNIESLEEVLDTLHQHIAALRAAGGRACKKGKELYQKTELRTEQLGRLHTTCNLLRAIIRVLSLTAKLQAIPHTSHPTGQGRDMLRASQMVQELMEVTEEQDLKGIHAIQTDLLTIPRVRKELKEQAIAGLNTALQNHNHSLVSNSLQALHNIQLLQPEINNLLDEKIKELVMRLRTLGHSTPGSTSITQTSAMSPGGPTPTSTPAGNIRANIWQDVQSFSQLLVKTTTNIHFLQTVIAKRKGMESVWKVSEEFWSKLGDGVRKEVEEKAGIVKQVLETEYPKFLRQIMEVKEAEVMRQSLECLETAYLSRTLSHMFDNVNMGFGEDYIPGQEEIAALSALILNQLQVTAFHPKLFSGLLRNVKKTIKLFAAKCEQSMQTDGEGSQVIGPPNSQQKRNLQVINALHIFASTLPAQAKKLEESAGNKLDWSNEIENCCDELKDLIRLALSPLIASVEDAVSAIIDTMHQEDFSMNQHQGEERQCSMYMRELQEFLGRIWDSHLSQYPSRDIVYEECKRMARGFINQFLLHASLVRPLGAAGRVRLAVDFAQMELAVSPLCRRVGTDLGKEYETLRAFRPMLFLSPQEILESPNLGKEVDYWLGAHLIMSNSEEQLPSPHMAANWSIARYSEWMAEHIDQRQRLQFLQGTLESYARRVHAEGGSEYVATYPILLKLLETATKNY